jgi:predicted RNA binding protein YcfA (HicA-like mRNA interferase family)
MGRLSGFRYRDVVKRLKRFGFAFDRQAAGSHEIWYEASSQRYTTIPNHPGDLPEEFSGPSCAKPARVWMTSFRIDVSCSKAASSSCARSQGKNLTTAGEGSAWLLVGRALDGNAAFRPRVWWLWRLRPAAL